MDAAQMAQVDESIRRDKIMPVLTDALLVNFRLKATPKKKPTAEQKEIKPEDLAIASGLFEITFVDTVKQQALGRYVFDRQTADELLKTLESSIKQFDEVLKKNISELMPKPPSNKPEGSMYR